MSKYSEHQLVFLDSETAGFKLSDGILELGAVATDITSRVVREELAVKVIPKKPKISARVASLNGFDAAQWAIEGVGLEVAIGQLADLIGEKRTLLVGHNIAFDWRFINEAGRLTGWRAEGVEGTIDTLWMARQVPGLDGHKLEQLCESWEIGVGQFHRALEDAHTCRLVYQALRTRGVAPKVIGVRHWWE